MSWTWSCLLREGAALKLQSSGWKRWPRGQPLYPPPPPQSLTSQESRLLLWDWVEQLFDLGKCWRFQRDLSVPLCWMVGLPLPFHFLQRSKLHQAETFLSKATSYPSTARVASGRTSIGFLPRARRYVSFWQFESQWLILAKSKGSVWSYVDMFETTDTVDVEADFHICLFQCLCLAVKTVGRGS